MSVDRLPDALFTSAQVREIDSSAINTHGIDGFTLMSSAAQFCFDTLIREFPKVEELVVLCGSGNNAGDGYLIATLAKKHSLQVKIIYLSPPEKLSGDAQKAYQSCLEAGLQCSEYLAKPTSLLSTNKNCVIIDALLGTGLNSPVRGPYAEIINKANQSGFPILSVDIPSGLCANTGKVLGVAMSASITCTFIGLKLGLLTGAGRTYTGETFYHSLEVPSNIILEQEPAAYKLSLSNLLKASAKRERHSHKGSFGHTLIIGGDKGFGGAAIMCAEAALRCGSGLTSVITHTDNCPALLARSPEVMVVSSENSTQTERLIETAKVIVIGPGLGKSAWSEKMLYRVLQLNKPLVIDADALNLLAEHPEWLENIISSEQLAKRIYTPHPGEAARLLGKESAALIQNNRLDATRALAKVLGGHVLLKGSGSLLISPTENVSLCPYGNPGMATGGMGDVLCGMIAALIAQGYNEHYALQLACCLHAYAADIEAHAKGEIGLTATDIIPTARLLLNKKAQLEASKIGC